MTFPIRFAQLAIGLALWVPAFSQAGLDGDGVSMDSVESEVADDAARDRRRILHLHSGGVLRARCRLRDETWEIWQKPTWQALPSGAVLRAVDEKVVLDQAERLERQARGDVLARVALAEWMIRQGLYAEAAEQLDRSLVEAPDCESALALVPRLRTPLEGELLAASEPGQSEQEAIEALLRTGARATPCIRELVILRLGELSRDRGPGDLGQGALLEQLRAALKASSPGMRAFAASALKRLYPGRAVGELSARAVLDSSSDAREAAVGALRVAAREVGDEIAAPMLSCLSNQHGSVRANAIQALGELGMRSSVAPLMSHLSALSSASGAFRPPASHIFVGRQMAYVQDFDVEVSQNAAIADPSINVLHEGSVLDVRLLSVSAPGMLAREGRCLREALSKLTGTAHGTNGAWLEWWSENRSLYETPKAPVVTGEAPGETP